MTSFRLHICIYFVYYTRNLVRRNNPFSSHKSKKRPRLHLYICICGTHIYYHRSFVHMCSNGRIFRGEKAFAVGGSWPKPMLVILSIYLFMSKRKPSGIRNGSGLPSHTEYISKIFSEHDILKNFRIHYNI